MNGLLTDGLVVFAYFAIVISIGLYKGRNNQSLESFAVGDRNIPWWAVLASILAAEISAATFLGAPGEGYTQRNFTYAQFALGTILARVIISYIFIKPYYDFRVVSIYEYLLIRFGSCTKNAASAIFLITRALASGTRLYVAAIVLVLGCELITGYKLKPLEQMPVYVGALIAITVLTTIYTTLGGIKAVVWTDVIQVVIMFGSLGFAIWSVLSAIPGGMTGVNAAMNQPGDWKFFDIGIDANRTFWGNVRSILESEYTIWAALIGSTFLTLGTHGTDQDMVQRMLTAKNYHRSRLSLILSGLVDLPLVLCFLFVGILLWGYYGQPGMDTPFAHYIIYEMPPGIRGLLVAGLFATAMGSLSTALNALATSFVEDWYRPYINRSATPKDNVRAARYATIVFAILLIIVGALTAYAKIVLQARIIPIVLGIFGYTYGSLLGVFLVGLLTRARGNERGNLIAMACGFLVVALLSGLHNDLWALLHPSIPHAILWKPEWLPKIEFPWRIAFGSITTFCVALCFRTPADQIQLTNAKRRTGAGT